MVNSIVFLSLSLKHTLRLAAFEFADLPTAGITDLNFLDLLRLIGIFFIQISTIDQRHKAGTSLHGM